MRTAEVITMASRGPRKGAFTSVDFRARARAAWAGEPPGFVLVLAELLGRDGATLRSVGDLVGYSPATLSEVLAGKYRGNLDAVRDRVEATMAGDKVVCPELGAIVHEQCRTWQDKSRRITVGHPLALTMRRACRACALCTKGGGK